MFNKEQVRSYADVMYTAERHPNLKFLWTKSGLEHYTDGYVMRKFKIGPLEKMQIKYYMQENKIMMNLSHSTFKRCMLLCY
jgi:hypothetical protein